LRELIEYVQSNEPEFVIEQQRKIEEDMIKKELDKLGKVSDNHQVWTDKEYNKALSEAERQRLNEPKRRKSIVVEIHINNRLHKLPFWGESIASVRTLLRALPKSDYKIL